MKQRFGRTNVRLIRRVIQPVVEALHPEKIVLFGSYASGRPHKDSDVDLLIVMRSKKRPVERAVDVWKSLNFYPFPMDILVRTPAEIRSRIRLGDPFYKEVLEKGKVLYES